MLRLLLFFFCLSCPLLAEVRLGVEVLFDERLDLELFNGKRVGLITNQTAVDHGLKTTLDLFRERVNLVAVFAPEHGLYGDAYSDERVIDGERGGIPIYSLQGQTRKPTDKMLAGIDVLVYDIQDVGARSYTFISTLFFVMEAAAEHKLPVVVLDRPNPTGGLVVDGPLLDQELRSFVGYVNVPYCHGMTIGELATLFNVEHGVGCELHVVAMKGWKRGMTFEKTGLVWIPTSPQIPEWDTSFFYPTTGLLGHLSMVSIGIGYTLPFKLVGAPWICADHFCDALNKQKLPGVTFHPFYYRPFFGKFKMEKCQGVRIVVNDAACFLPITTQYTIMGVLKNLYPQKYDESLASMLKSKWKREMFEKLNGNHEVLSILKNERFIIWKLREICKRDCDTFLPIRKKYLNKNYS